MLGWSISIVAIVAVIAIVLVPFDVGVVYIRLNESKLSGKVF